MDRQQPEPIGSILNDRLGLLDSISNIEAPKKRQRSVHRRYAPKFDRPQHLPLTKLLDVRLQQHDWDKNPYYVNARKNGGTIKAGKDFKKNAGKRVIAPRHRKTRKERAETMTAVLRAALYHVELSSAGEYLFEVNTGIEQLASMIGQKHVYPARKNTDGEWQQERVVYDCVLNALKDLELAKLLILSREFDTEAARYKAMRLFLRPEFFASMGVSKDKVSAFIRKHDGFLKHKKRWSQKVEQRRRHELNEARQADFSRICNHGLKTLLKRIKSYYLDSDDKQTQKSAKDAQREIKKALKERQSLEEQNNAEPTNGQRVFANYGKAHGFPVAMQQFQRLKAQLLRERGNHIDDSDVYERFAALYGSPPH
jgi:hypothetical protein